MIIVEFRTRKWRGFLEWATNCAKHSYICNTTNTVVKFYHWHPLITALTEMDTFPAYSLVRSLVQRHNVHENMIRETRLMSFALYKFGPRSWNLWATFGSKEFKYKYIDMKQDEKSHKYSKVSASAIHYISCFLLARNSSWFPSRLSYICIHSSQRFVQQPSPQERKPIPSSISNMLSIVGSTMQPPGLSFPTFGLYTLILYSINSWYGIRYAAAPVGNLRWQPPVPIEGNNHYSKSVPMNATQIGSTCIQGYPSYQGDIPVSLVGASEDCLLLDVKVPAKPVSSMLPVMLQIHGGGKWPDSAWVRFLSALGS